MSLVGPRPLILDEDQFVVSWARRRLKLKPGMTGLWQVLGASDIPFDEMTKLDYVYVTNWSLREDLRLILLTLPALVGRGQRINGSLLPAGAEVVSPASLRSADGQAACRCGPARADGRRPGDVAAVRELPQRRPDPAHGAVFPLHVFACERCYLVQLEAFVPPNEIFSEYAYYSAYSTDWVEHARQYVGMIRNRLALGADDLVVELASNDGYLLQHFVGTGIPILGIDPAANVAEAAEERGVPLSLSSSAAQPRRLWSTRASVPA